MGQSGNFLMKIYLFAIFNHLENCWPCTVLTFTFVYTVHKLADFIIKLLFVIKV